MHISCITVIESRACWEGHYSYVGDYLSNSILTKLKKAKISTADLVFNFKIVYPSILRVWCCCVVLGHHGGRPKKLNGHKKRVLWITAFTTILSYRDLLDLTLNQLPYRQECLTLNLTKSLLVSNRHCHLVPDEYKCSVDYSLRGLANSINQRWKHKDKASLNTVCDQTY